MNEKNIKLVYYWNWYWDEMMHLNNKQGLSLYHEEYDYIKEKADKPLFDEIYKKIIKKLNEMKIKYDTKELDLSNKGRIERSIITYWDTPEDLKKIEIIVWSIIEDYGLERGTLFFKVNILALKDKIVIEAVEKRDSEYDVFYEVLLPSSLVGREETREEIQRLCKEAIEYISYIDYNFKPHNDEFWVTITTNCLEKNYDDFVRWIELYVNFLKRNLEYLSEITLSKDLLLGLER